MTTAATAHAQFASDAWCELARVQLSGSSELRDAAARWAFGPIMLVAGAEPDGGGDAAAIVLSPSASGVGVRAVSADRARRHPWVLWARGERWSGIVEGRLDVVSEILDARVRCRGDVPTLARHRDLLAGIVAALGSVPTAWEPTDGTEPASQ